VPIRAHARLAEEIAPVKIAGGEHIPNRVLFKNFMQAGALHYVQADCTRLVCVSDDASPWVPEVSNHQRILDSLKMGDPHLAEQTVVHITGLFLKAALAVWTH
jgi:Enolase C-terminal domain-like